MHALTKHIHRRSLVSHLPGVGVTKWFGNRRRPPACTPDVRRVHVDSDKAPGGHVFHTGTDGTRPGNDSQSEKPVERRLVDASQSRGERLRQTFKSSKVAGEGDGVGDFREQERLLPGTIAGQDHFSSLSIMDCECKHAIHAIEGLLDSPVFESFQQDFGVGSGAESSAGGLVFPRRSRKS